MRLHSVGAMLAAGLLSAFNSASAEVTKIAELRIPAQATDQSNLTGKLENRMPLNQFGGIGALSWAGENVYYLLPDRGPDDGAVPYPTRFHQAQIQFTAEGSVEWKLLETHLLTKDSGEQLVGAASALKHGDKHPGRLDPEAIRFVQRGNKPAVLAISDEYGPRVDLYDLTGKRTRKLRIPGKFEIEHPSGNAAEEAQKNDKGRQPNAGFEALGISPDGQTLYAMNQRPLIQDGAVSNGRFTGLLNRILRIDIDSEDTREFVYPLENSDSAVCELLMIDNHRALVLERDSLAGLLAKQKSLYLIDLQGASDVSEHKSLPPQAAELPTEVRIVTKRLFADLLDPKFRIVGESTPAKFEGLTFGPNLPDGRRTLVISVDNDFRSDNPTVFYVLALAPEDLK